ncbi:MAG: N-acetyltransferase [Bauldia sp.]
MGRTRVLKPSEILRRGRLPADGLALVARERGRLVGSVRLWNVEAGGRPALLLGAAGRRSGGAGQGRRLGPDGSSRSSAPRRSATVALSLVGDPEYYERFGFSAAPTGGLLMPAPVERRRFLALELAPRALAGAAGRIVATGVPLAAAERIAA